VHTCAYACVCICVCMYVCIVHVYMYVYVYMYNFSSRIRFPCPRAPLLVSRSRGRYVGSRSHHDHGEEGDLVELVSACEIAIPVTLDARHIECTLH